MDCQDVTEKIAGFNTAKAEDLKRLTDNMGLSFSEADLTKLQYYFVNLNREPTKAELVLFNAQWGSEIKTCISNISVNNDNYALTKAAELYDNIRPANKKSFKSSCDLSLAYFNKLRADGKLRNVLKSGGNAVIEYDIDGDGREEPYILSFNANADEYELENCENSFLTEKKAVETVLGDRAIPLNSVRLDFCANVNEKPENVDDISRAEAANTSANVVSEYLSDVACPSGTVKELYDDTLENRRVETCFITGIAPENTVNTRKPLPDDTIFVLSADCNEREAVRRAGNFFKNKKIAKYIVNCESCVNGLLYALANRAAGIEADIDGIVCSETKYVLTVRAKEIEEFKAVADNNGFNVIQCGKVTDGTSISVKKGGSVAVDVESEFLQGGGAIDYVDVTINEKNVPLFDYNDGLTDMYLRDGNFIKAALNELNRLDNCSQKGLQERFDCLLKGNTIITPFGGQYRLTPNGVGAIKPVVHGETDAALVYSYGVIPSMFNKSPFAAGLYSVITAVTKQILAGVGISKIKLFIHNIYGKDGFNDYTSFNLGALYAQSNLDVAAIGAKNDTLQSDFKSFNVHAVGLTRASTVITDTFETEGTVYTIPMPRDEKGIPDFEKLNALYVELSENVKNGNIKHSTSVGEGGAVTATMIACMGNGLGCKFVANAELFKPYYGDIIVMCEDITPFISLGAMPIGEVDSAGIFNFNDTDLNTFGATQAYSSRLEDVYKTVVPVTGNSDNVRFRPIENLVNENKVNKPKVLIATVDGAYNENELYKRFRNLGADVTVLTCTAQNTADLSATVAENNIIVFPNGAEGILDKNIETILDNKDVRKAVEEFISRKGLMYASGVSTLALVRVGLLPFGKFCKDERFTLKCNTIGRRISTIATVKISSVLSPWFTNREVGEVLGVPVTVINGRFAIERELLDELIKNGQIASQFVDERGYAIIDAPYNLTGSEYAIESLTSPDGLILGRLGDVTATDKNLYKNNRQQYNDLEFEAGVNFCKL